MRRLALLLICLALPAQAQQICGPRDEIVTRLDRKYQEYRRSSGVAFNGHFVEVFAADRGTWTIIVSQPNGVSCVLAGGDHWQRDKKPADET